MQIDGDGYGCSTAPPPSVVYLVVSSLTHQNRIHHLLSKLKPTQIRDEKTQNVMNKFQLSGKNAIRIFLSFFLQDQVTGIFVSNGRF